MSKKKLLIWIAAGALLLAAALTVTLVLTVCSHRRTTTVELRAPTCTETGERATVCSRCGKTIAREEIPALGHLWGAWEVRTAPTTLDAGLWARVCGRDDTHAETRAIPALDETNYARTVLTEATCTQEGVAEYASSEYGTYQAAIPKLAHTLTDGHCAVCDRQIASAGLTYELCEDGKSYRVSDAEHRLSDTALRIPDSQNGLPVREIASEGFAERVWLKSVKIPPSIVSIGDGAFSGAGIEEIDYNAVRCADFNARNWVFYPAESVREVRLTVGANVERLPARMFYPLVTDPFRLPRLTSVAFTADGALKEIGDYAFYRAANLGAVDLPARLETIGDYAFYGCGAEALKTPDSLTAIGNGAFGACERLRSVAFGKNLRRVGDDAFNYCVSLESADFDGTSLRTLGKDAFKNCAQLTAVSLGGCAEIGESAFGNCSSLVSLDLGDALTRIGADAFRDCGGLVSVALPATLREIGGGAFADCAALERIDFCAADCADFAAGNNVFAACGTAGEGIEVRIAAGVTKIPARLFYATSDAARAPNLRTVAIETALLQTVGDYAFFGTSLSQARFLGTAAQWRGVAVGRGNDALDALEFAGGNHE